VCEKDATVLDIPPFRESWSRFKLFGWNTGGTDRERELDAKHSSLMVLFFRYPMEKLREGVPDGKAC
jgi:hypothetical protein